VFKSFEKRLKLHVAQLQRDRAQRQRAPGWSSTAPNELPSNTR
jgi:hypothetical protein